MMEIPMMDVPMIRDSYARAAILTLLALLLGGCGAAVADATGAGTKIADGAPNALPELPGERRFLSLRVLCDHVGRSGAGRLSSEALALGEIGRLEGYYVDEANRDVVLVGRREPGRPSLHLDDLSLALAARSKGSPYCSLDPRAANMTEVRRVMREGVRLGDAAALADFVSRLEKALGPQDVKIGGGVPARSRWGRQMIFADYAMKKISQGLLRVDGVPSSLDLALARRRHALASGDRSTTPGASMSRFWFHVGAGDPTFLESDGIVMIRSCRVVVLTEAQRCAADGELSDSGERNRHAETWATAFSDGFSNVTKAVPVCASLENLYRLLAVVRAMELRGALREAGLDVSALTQGYVRRDDREMEPWLDGLANAASDRFVDEARGRIHVFASVVCGGVSMTLAIDARKLRRVPGLEPLLDALRRTGISRRVGQRLWWTG